MNRNYPFEYREKIFQTLTKISVSITVTFEQLFEVCGEDDREGGALAGTALGPYLSPVILDDLVTDRKSKPCANPTPFRRETGIEDFRQVFLRNTDTVILEQDMNLLIFGKGGYGDRSFALDGLLAVDEQVEKNLVQLAGEARNGGDVSIILDDLDGVFQLMVG